MPADDKWKANMEKVAYMKAFPGLLNAWDQLTGKTVETVVPLKSKAGSAALICTDGSFVVVPLLSPEPYELGEALQVGRASLEPKHGAAWRRIRPVAQKGTKRQRTARLRTFSVRFATTRISSRN